MKAGRFAFVAMIVFALVVVPSAAYVGGYYGLQWDTTVYVQSGRGESFKGIRRCYAKRWQATIFNPAAAVESWITGHRVEAYCFGDQRTTWR